MQFDIALFYRLPPVVIGQYSLTFAKIAFNQDYRILAHTYNSHTIISKCVLRAADFDHGYALEFSRLPDLMITNSIQLGITEYHRLAHADIDGLGKPRYEPVPAIQFHTSITSKYYGDDYAAESN